MSELVIQYHGFENAKKELKDFSEQTATDLDLKKVDDSKGVGKFLGDRILGRGIGLDHNVTGEELNNLTAQIQTHLHSINNTQIKLIKEFGQVYSALEALDKDYIQAILISIKATEETSLGIQETQEQIRKIVENQRKTLEELKKFKQNLDGNVHLRDIDKLWGDCQKWHQEMISFSDDIVIATENSKESVKKVDALELALAATEKKASDLSAQVFQMIKSLESINAFTNTLEEIAHLQDVDSMWESLTMINDAIISISGEIENIQRVAFEHQDEIHQLLAFSEKASVLKHLMDVDNTWKRTEEQQHHLKELDGINKEQYGILDSLIREKEEINGHVAENKEDIRHLNEYISDLNHMAHLDDVDDTWQTVKNHSGQLIEMGKQNNSLISAVQKNKEEVNIEIAKGIKHSDDTIASLAKKVKYAYWIAGGSAGLAIIELMLLLLKVI